MNNMVCCYMPIRTPGQDVMLFCGKYIYIIILREKEDNRVKAHKEI